MSEEVLPSLLAMLVERLSSQEGLEVEFKSAKGGLPTSLWPTVSAFANTNGGWIILGINHDEQTNKATIQGVSNPPAMLQNFYNSVRNQQKVSVPICGANDAKVEELGEQQLIIIRVPATPRKLRPVYINGNAYGGTYLRRNSGDYLCTKQEVDRMMREASDVAADSTILKHYTWDDLDLDTLARYRRQYQTFNPSSPWNGYTNEGFLQAIKGYRRDREAGEAGITVAGLLLVGKPEAIREWRTRHLLDYRLVADEETTETRWEDRVTWEGNIFDGFSAIYPRLVGSLPIPFRLQNGIRVSESDVHVALREALVNLLVHADYAETGASLIIRSPSAYFFRNPGSSRVLEMDLLAGGRSDPRNPELVRMFRMVGLAEEAGTGIPKIIRTWRELGLQLPPIDIGTERYEFTLNLRRAHLLSEDDRIWLSSFGESWSEAEQLALITAKHEGDIDNPRLRKLTGQHMYDAAKVLGSLRDRQFLTISHIGRTPRYQLGQRAASISAAIASSASLGINETSLGIKQASLGINETSLGIKQEARDVLWSELEKIAEPARSQARLNRRLRDEVIIELCSYTALSIADLSKLMNRGTEAISRAVQHLILQEELNFLYPDRPRHPHQKYVASQLTAGPEAEQW